ncbi:hypothetical protein [Nitrosomonas communis]|uniref:Uncharacterized protein n=1 Tax=Nitrosomonas communis TaxID=44574 RepID=A0A1I4WI26_9PROT|nr:hypothetical protein [Nitrosomonas communis]SFN13328.1 hypothetical protein SAMN05421863_11104 [Nitrosomonas communis]
MRNKWMTREKFEKFCNSGGCWIAIEGMVALVFYSDEKYMSYDDRSKAYPAESILAVMPLLAPEYPEEIK